MKTFFIQKRRTRNMTTMTTVRVWRLTILVLTILLQLQLLPVNIVSANSINGNHNAKNSANASHRHAHGKYGLFSSKKRNQSTSSTSLSTIHNYNHSSSSFLHNLFKHIQNNILPKSKFQKYIQLIQSLQDQMTTLQRQIRQQRDEIHQLRQKLKLQKYTTISNSRPRSVIRKLQSFASPSTTTTNDSIDDVDSTSNSKLIIEEYKTTIQTLQSQLTEMTNQKKTIEETLYTEKQQLSTILNESNINHETIQKKLKVRIEELQNLQRDTLDLVLLERQKYTKIGQHQIFLRSARSASRDGRQNSDIPLYTSV